MKTYNVELSPYITLESYIMRVEANNKKEALAKLREIGFNAGKRLSSCYSGKYRKKSLSLETGRSSAISNTLMAF
jgi:hypothetical protein